MSTENIIIWPDQYALLLKGLLEQNGAYILDALEAWPQCKSTTDEQGICSIILPPIYYLLWHKPLDPFVENDFQHLHEFDQDEESYIQQAVAQIKQQLETDEKVSLLLISRLTPYADEKSQCLSDCQVSLAHVCQTRRFFIILKNLLDQDLKLTNQDVIRLWQEEELQLLVLPYLYLSCIDKPGLIEIFTQRLLQGEDCFELLSSLQPEQDNSEILNQALLAQLSCVDTKQSLCQQFLAQGADGSICDENGKTCLMWAAEQGFINIMQEIANQQNINEKDIYGNTPLHYAIISQNELVISFILNKGADYTIKNFKGLTPYGLAVDTGYKKCILLLEHKFGIKELSQLEQFKRIDLVHSIHAIVCFLFPLQLFSFFTKEFNYKSEVSFILTLVSLLILFLAMSLKRCNLYPYIKHPKSLSALRFMSPLSLVSQLILLLVVIIVALS